jgi:DNA polymerase III subunit beta
MHILIHSRELANAARLAAKAIRADVGRRIPILKCCRLTAGGNLSVYGTDLDTSITAIADCDVVEPGEAIVDAQKLADIAAKLPQGGDVRIETTADGLTVKCGRSRFTLTTQPLCDYPDPLAVDGDNPPIELTAADIMVLFAGATAGAARDDKRIYLSGAVLFSEETSDGLRLCAVGSDVLRSAMQEQPRNAAIFCPELLFTATPVRRQSPCSAIRARRCG